MNTYIANFIDSSCTSLDLYSYKNGIISSDRFADIGELKSFDDSCLLIVLIPSLLITSYQNSKNLGLAEDINLANFISDIDDKVVDQVSYNEFLFHDKNAFIINKTLLETLNKALTQLDTNIILMPEYSFFNHKDNHDVIFEINNRFIFSNSDGTGTSLSRDTLEQYCQVISDLKDGYSPLIYSDDNFLKEKYPNSSFITSGLESFFNQDFSRFPNFYNFYFSYQSLKRKFNFSTTQLIITLTGLFTFLFIPSMLINNNNDDALAYKEATFDIFTAINKDIKKVVRPRAQIDSIMSQVILDKNNNIELPSLNFLDQIGDEYLDRIYIDFNNSKVLIDISEMPLIQYNLIKNISQQFSVDILNEEIMTANNIISGSITVSLLNE
tara:strand:+ start:114 stop:1262 length:1149 start_codon:yes stop_codon:yes gene_type:complete